MTSRRRAPRLDRELRIGYRPDASSVWCRGNAINVSEGGLFFVSYEDAPPADLFEIEIYDLGDRPVQARGRIAWTKSWHDGPQLPGFGVELDVPLPRGLLRHSA